LVLRGLVKQHDSDLSLVMYSPRGCETWMPIPKRGIRKIDLLGQAPCVKEGEPEHTHPFVALFLAKDVGGDLPHLAAISALQAAAHPPHARGETQLRGGRAAPTRARGRLRGIRRTRTFDCDYGFGPCGGYNTDWGQYCSCDERPCYDPDGYYCAYDDF